MGDTQPATAGEAVTAVTAGLSYLARVDAASLGSHRGRRTTVTPGAAGSGR